VTSHIVDAKELAAALNVIEMELQHIAHDRRLPFLFSTAFGFFCHRRNLPQWKRQLSLRPTTVVKIRNSFILFGT
jgi:hypothetical protein